MARPAVALRRRARILRGIGVCAAASLIALIFGVYVGQGAAWSVLLVGLPVLTLATIPRDLAPGEYDLFAIGVVALLVCAAVLLQGPPRTKTFFTKYDDPCSTGCGEGSF